MKNATLNQEDENFIGNEKVAESKDVEPKSKGNKLNIIDILIQKLPFTKFHYIITMVCIFSMICEGLIRMHLSYITQFLTKTHGWGHININLLLIFQLLFQSFGAFISQNARNIYWDVSSNALLAFLGFLNVIMIIIYSDPIVYAVSICIFSVFHGFIANICTNYLLEIMNVRIRSTMFLVVWSFVFLGKAVYGAIIWYLNIFRLVNPHLLLIPLSISQLFLCIYLLYMCDSPRILFNNNDYLGVYEFVIEIPEDEFKKDTNKGKIISMLEKTKTTIDEVYSKQDDEGIMRGFYSLFTKEFGKNTFKAILFVGLSTMFISNVKDSYPFGSKINHFSGKGHEIMTYYLTQFLLINFIIILYHVFDRIKTIYYAVFSLLLCISLMIILLVLRDSFIAILSVYEAIATFYFMLSYLYFSELITTKLRNVMTSVLHITVCLTSIIQLQTVDAWNSLDPYSSVYINILIGLALIAFEIFLKNEEDPRQMNLQEIDFAILQKHKEMS
jgi:hypothetical protein